MHIILTSVLGLAASMELPGRLHLFYERIIEPSTVGVCVSAVKEALLVSCNPPGYVDQFSTLTRPIRCSVNPCYQEREKQTNLHRM